MHAMSDLSGIKFIFFDLMGTCLDWHSSIVQVLPASLSQGGKSQLALDWRQGFFDEIHARFLDGLPQENIDLTHRRVLDKLLRGKWQKVSMTEGERVQAVSAWHAMKPWLDVPANLERLKSKHELFVLANGTTRLQLDLMRASGLRFDLLMSSELLGLTKPDPAIYRKAIRLVGASAGQCLMVAAHAYDLRAAKKLGMKTAYVERWTEDQNENMEELRGENDLFIEIRDKETKGFEELAQLLGV